MELIALDQPRLLAVVGQILPIWEFRFMAPELNFSQNE